MQKDRFFCRKCLTSRFRAIPIGVFLEALKNAYLILLREVCWNRCRRHRFQLSLAHYFTGGAPLPQSVETCTAIVLTVDTFWGSPTLNLEGWGGFKVVGVLSLKSLWILFKPVWLDVVFFQYFCFEFQIDLDFTIWRVWLSMRHACEELLCDMIRVAWIHPQVAKRF